MHGVPSMQVHIEPAAREDGDGGRFKDLRFSGDWVRRGFSWIKGEVGRRFGGDGGRPEGQSPSPEPQQSQVSDEPSKSEPLPERVIRERIREGNRRRRRANMGTLKRLSGNCFSLLASICLLTVSCMSAASHYAQKVYGDSRPDVCEIFGGAAEVSLQFSRRGWFCSEPIDICYGSDLRDQYTRDRIKGFIKEQKPRLLIVSYPCTYWSSLAATNYVTPQQKRRLSKLRKADEVFLELCEELFNIMVEQGGDILLENPLASASFRRPAIQRILCSPLVYAGISHGCRFNFRSSADGKLLRKPTMWISTSPEICDELSLRCPNTKTEKIHEHGECQGGHVAKDDGRYTKEVAKAIHRGYVRLIGRKDPSRISRLLKAVSHRIRNGETGLKWDEHSIQRALGKINSVFAQEADQPSQGSEDNPEAPQVPSSGISFEVPEGRKLDEPTKALLRKVHCNLGHPHVSDLQRFLRGAGASQEMIEAVGFIRCVSCARTQRPRIHRTVRIPPHDLQFNDQVMIDCFFLKDVCRKGAWFMSILDRATMYHQAIVIDNHAPESFVRCFMDYWVKWAGKPLEVSIDLETGLGSREFGLALGEAGITVVPIAGQAHWQHGKVERHGSILKDMLSKVAHQIDGKNFKQLQWMVDEVVMAKNSLIREHGFSPSQLLFGKEPRSFGEVEENGQACSMHPSVGDKGSQVAIRMRMRCEARHAFVKAQANQMLQQTVRNRTRPWVEPQIGDRCFFYREFRRKGVSGLVKAWHGPGLVVGIQGQSNVWVVFGGKCYLIAQEHCRPAVGEEAIYGRPEIQEAISVFRGMQSTDRGYEDLTKQQGNGTDELDKPVDDQVMDSDDDMEPGFVNHPNPSRLVEVPEELKNMCTSPGWKTDEAGNPVQIAYKSFAFRTPIPQHDGTRFPYRSSWAYIKGSWSLLEDEVKWANLEDSSELIPGGPADILISVFKGRTRKQICLDDVPGSFKKPRVGHSVLLNTSRRKEQKALDKEIPYGKIKPSDREAYAQAEAKEWASWLQYDAVEPLSVEESKKVVQLTPERVIKCRFVYRNKNAGLVDENGESLGIRAKARLCVQGQNDPDCLSGDVKLDAPTIQHSSFMTFLHCVVSFGWVANLRNGDISSAFLQGEETQGEPLYMHLPERGLPNLVDGQILRLKRPVYGRPDAPRAWYNQISG